MNSPQPNTSNDWAVTRLAVAAQTQGWRVTRHVDSTSGAHTVTAQHPKRPEQRVTVTYPDGNSTTHRRATSTLTQHLNGKTTTKPRNIGVGEAENVLTSPPLTAVQTVTDGNLTWVTVPMLLPAVNGCVCCGDSPPAEAELTLTLAGLCHVCATWHSREGERVVDSNCQHRDPNSWEDGDEMGERWRADPRAHLDDEGSGDSLRWLQARDRRVTLGFNVDGYAINEGLNPCIRVSPYSGNTYLHLDGQERIDLKCVPARHEALDILAIHARRNGDTVDRLRRLLAHSNETIRTVAQRSPHAHLVGQLVWVEKA